jgi:hypothetical protein
MLARWLFIRTGIVECLERALVNGLKDVDPTSPEGAEISSITYSGPSFFSNSLTFRDNASVFLLSLLLISLADLPAEIVNLAIGLGLSLIAADDADHFLCIRLLLGHVWLLTLRILWHGGD